MLPVLQIWLIKAFAGFVPLLFPAGWLLTLLLTLFSRIWILCTVDDLREIHCLLKGKNSQTLKTCYLCLTLLELGEALGLKFTGQKLMLKEL